MQIGDVVSVDDEVRRGGPKWRWTERHPHLALAPDRSNTLYVAAQTLSLPRLGRAVPGAGAFEFADDDRRLTAEGATGPCEWSLPIGFMPRNRPPLSYHGAAERWVRRAGAVRLRAVTRGQEFVLDLDAYPEILGWLARLLGGA
jgi:hypothetical protein